MAEDREAAVNLTAWERASIPLLFASSIALLGAVVFAGESLAGYAVGLLAVALSLWVTWSTRKSSIWKRNIPQ